jgi:hypothetical protein
MTPNFGELCSIAAGRSPEVEVTTNGTCVDLDIVKQYITQMRISIDTIHPELARQLKGPSYHLWTVLETLDEIVERDLCKVSVNFVRTALNADEWPYVEAVCKSRKIDVCCCPVYNWFYQGQLGYVAAHTLCVDERRIFGSISREQPRCPWLHSNQYYYDAGGRRHICCIRMAEDQISMDPAVMCTTCPD